MNYVTSELLPLIRQAVDADISSKVTFDELKEQLSSHINELINKDFQKLVGILYRIDVNEQKLKYLLNENPGTDAGKIIADLIIERQLQKLRSRQQNSKRDENISEEEKW